MNHSPNNIYAGSAFSSFPLRYKIQEAYIQEQLFGYIPMRRFFIQDLLLPRLAGYSEILVHHPLLRILFNLRDSLHRKKRSIYLLETTAHKRIYLNLNDKNLFILRNVIGKKSKIIQKQMHTKKAYR
jgi:hypothetical protein